MKLKFIGAVREVTGSCHILETGKNRVMLDCGGRQGSEKTPDPSLDKYNIVPSSIDCIVLSHGHYDHCGMIPYLVKLGFKGRIFGTPSTFDIAELIMKDSAHLMVEENKQDKSKKVYYDETDVENTIRLFHPVLYEEPKRIADGVTLVLHDAGHILGSSSVELRVEENGLVKTVIFSGDIGGGRSKIMNVPKQPNKADYLILESTYGNRLHHTTDPWEEIEKIAREVISRGGRLLIPAFAVGRCQDVLYALNSLYNMKRLPHTNVYVDSPMACDVTILYHHAALYLNPEFRSALSNDPRPFDFGRLEYVKKRIRSEKIAKNVEPSIIIAASGMCEGGRIMNYLPRILEEPRSCILFVGYQGDGTRGRAILEGAKEINISGRVYKVRCEVKKINSLSAHADKDGLKRYVEGIASKPKKVFVVHGEKEPAEMFANDLKEIGIDAVVPYEGDEVEI